MTSIARLDAAIKAAGIPIHGVSGTQGNVRIDFNGATAQQKTDAAAIVAGFDWSDAANEAADAAATKAAIVAALDKGVTQEGDKTDRLVAALVKVIAAEFNLDAAVLIASVKAEVNSK